MIGTKESNAQKRVGVLMSGGVDSSVAAHVLLQDGYAVSGVFITIWNPSHIPCTVAADRQDAMRACATLGIPFIEYDATAVYQEKVIKPFVEAYRQGETPNPDVLCNQFIKFDVVFDFVREKGFDNIATGHYAQVREIDGIRRLCRSVDEDKDQTYFIYTISQEVLNQTMFPVGGCTKKQVRAIAEDVGLPAAQKKDSVGLCFLGDVSMRDFLSVYIEPKEGEVRHHESEESIGTHSGAWFYTPGQRHGFTITKTGKCPYVVVSKDVAKNIIYVRRSGSDTDGSCQHILNNLMFRQIPKDEEALVARYRHRGGLYPISFVARGDSVEIAFKEPQQIAVGQSVVVYEGKECLGGGVVLG